MGDFFMKKVLALGLIFAAQGAYAESVDLANAIAKTRSACGGISASMADMKLKAGINTAVTAVGTAAGGVALGTGIAKAKIDEDIEEIKKQIEEMLQKMEQQKITQHYEKINVSDAKKDLDAYDFNVTQQDKDDLLAKVDKLTKKSKTLGNVRTGTLAAATATNIAGAAIAGTNMVKQELSDQVKSCLDSVKELSNAKMQARMDGSADDAQLAKTDAIISACGEWEFVDLTPINKRATGAAVSSGVGAGLGLIGTITSGAANSNSVRAGDEQKEKALNTTANIMAGGTAAASLTATIFNATQISAIKKAATVADSCEGALK
jgi:hypothetical protein